MGADRRIERVAVAWGSNLGRRERFAETGLAAVADLPGTRLLARSSMIETEPVGGPPQGPFLNGAVVLDTELSPFTLLESLLRIEATLGRQRRVRNGPRTLDLDLVFYGGRTLTTPRLVLPHPRASQRRFVLEPLAQIAADWVHAGLGRTVRQLLATCPSAVGAADAVEQRPC